MAARRIPDDNAPPRQLPLSVHARPAVAAARQLHQRAEAEAARCEALVAAAVEAIDLARAASAGRLLEALKKGEPPPVDDPSLIEARVAAVRALERAKQAVGLAGAELQSAIAASRAALADELRPLLAEHLAVVAITAREAAEANAILFALAEFAEREGCLPCRAYELSLKIPAPAVLDEQLAAKRSLLAPPAHPAPPPPGVVAIRWLVNSMPYMAGERCGLPKADAVLAVRAGFAELVDPEEAKELKLHKLVKFDTPMRVKLTKNFMPRQGVMTPAGTVEVFDAATAARIVNLGFGEIA